MKRTLSGKAVFTLYCLVQILYWAGGCVAIGFAAAFLGELGFSNTVIGLVVSVSSVAGFALMLSVSARIDARGGRTLFRSFDAASLMLTVLLLAVFLVRKPTAVTALCYIAYMASTHLLGSLVTKLYIDLRKVGYAINFGVARGLGSLAYALCSLLAGWASARRPGSFYQFVALGCFLLVLLISFVLRGLPPLHRLAGEAREAPPSAAHAIGFLRRDGLFLALVIGVALVSATNKTTSSFLVNIVEDIGGDRKAFGLVNGYLALVEVPMILLYSRIRKRFSASSLLLISMVFFSLKTAAYTFIRSVPLLLLASTLQAFSVGLYQPSSVDFVVEKLPHEHTATGQSCLNGMPLLFSFVTTVVFGFLLDRFPVSACMAALLLCSLAGTFVCALAIRRMERGADGTASD